MSHPAGVILRKLAALAILLTGASEVAGADASAPPAAVAVPPALWGASARDTEVCDREAARAARRFGVPEETLMAIGRVESGMTRNGVFAPWPWTINVGGRGLRFRSRSEAVRYASGLLARGIRSFDVGCFQLNYRWHGWKFDDLEQMFSPRDNAEGSARFLAQLFREHGNWRAAIGAYHSRTTALAKAYLARVLRVRQGLAGPQRPLPFGPLVEAVMESAPASRKTNLPLVNLQESRGPLF